MKLPHTDTAALERRRVELEAELVEVRCELYRRAAEAQMRQQRERDAWLRSLPPETLR